MEEQNPILSPETPSISQENVTEQLQQIIQTAPQQAEAVAVQVEYAGFWVRFAALLVDGLILAIPSGIINAIFGKSFGGFLGYVLMWAYAIYMLNTYQATLGKMAVGLKVTTIDGGKPTLGKLALREIVGKILDLITIGIGYLMVAFTEKKQGLHDKIADTVVVYDPARKRRFWIVVLSIMFAAGIPLIGIMASIVLVSTNSAKVKAQQVAAKAFGKSILPEIIICKADGGNVNAYQANKTICDASSHSITWPDVSSLGYKVNAPAAKNTALETYSFTITKEGASNIVCSLAENDCK